ncbi:S8 family serine peptidase, partial [Actinotalea ferrariae]|uniref:S8 family serine peptidase n=1 Tax=Actinotalea ferrariae TaxID=1386098 RepID=UPI001C8CCB19
APADGAAVRPSPEAGEADRGAAASAPETVQEAGATSTSPAPGPAPEPAPGSVLVEFDANATAAERSAVLDRVGGVVESEVEGTEFVVVAIGDQDPTSVAAELDADPDVGVAQPDYLRAADVWPDDPALVTTWPYLDLTRFPRAWDETIGQGTVVAVLDTGVYAAHEDLVGGLLPGVDFVNLDGDPADDNGHGTFVAGVVAATGNNGRGNVGAAPGATVLPIKVLDHAGRGRDSVVGVGIAEAVASGVDVINLSLGGADPSPVLRAAIEEAVAAGVVVVAAAGNDRRGGPQYPAAYAPEIDGLVSVSATDDDGTLADYSSWDDTVSLAAPGTDIVGPGIGAPNRYVSDSGTSFAAPLVSGAVALMRAQRPGLAPSQVEERLLAATRDAGPRGVDPFFGRGILDAAAALGAVPALPLDRGLRDDDGTDDVPAGATVLTVGSDRRASARGTLDLDGGIDWYRYDAPTPGSYDISVAPGTTASLALFARDAAGDVVAGPVRWPHSLRVDGAGPWWIGVRGEAAVEPYERYEFTVAWAIQPPEVPVDFGPAQVLSPDGTGLGGVPTLLADVTGDGLEDVVTARSVMAPHPGGGTGVAPAVGIYPATSATGFGAYRGVRLGASMGLAPALAAADLDGDGTHELVAGEGADDGTSRLWLVDGRATTLTPVLAREGGVLGAWWQTTDLDVDGRDEVLMSTTSGVRVVRMTAGVVEVVEWPAWTAGSAPRLAVVDVDADGDLDVVGGDLGTLLQQADGSFAPGTPVAALAGPEQVAVGDVTGDGLDDVAFSAGRSVRLAAGLAGGGFAAPIVLGETSQAPRTLVVTDVDGDGLRDVLTVDRSHARAFLRKSDGTFRPPVGSGVTSLDGRAAVRDQDADGDADLLFVSSAGLAVSLQLEPTVPNPPPGWVWDASVARDEVGVGVRPTLTLAFLNDLVAGSVDARTVRLVDGTTGGDVALDRTYAAADGVLSATPTADLVRGRHYELVVAGLRDDDGEVMTEPFRTWFTVAADGERFTPVAPVRVLDTRWGDAPAQPGEPVHVDLSYDVPDDATAVVLNVAAAAPSSVGNVRVYPSTADGSAPRVANLNVVPGVDQSNLVTVALSPDGWVSLLTEGMSAELIADLAGYYSPGGATAFVPLSPVRALDMRDGTGGVDPGRLQGGAWVDVQVTGRNGVPADASAVVLNLAATGVVGRTHVRVYPTPADSEDQTPPDIANLNAAAGRDQPNLVTVRVGDGGRIRLYSHSAALFLVADLAGYYSPTGDHGFVPLEPQRVADSRTGLGLPRGPLRAGTTTDLAVTGRAGIPADAASVVLNVAATQVSRLTHVRAFPTTVPATLPDVSTLNLVPGRDESNHAIVRLGHEGRVTFYPHSSDLQLVVDAFGYFRR